MNEAERFTRAFNFYVNHDVKPTPTLLNKAIGRSGRVLPGRLSKLRRQLLVKAGYKQVRTRYFIGHWKK